MINGRFKKLASGARPPHGILAASGARRARKAGKAAGAYREAPVLEERPKLLQHWILSPIPANYPATDPYAIPVGKPWKVGAGRDAIREIAARAFVAGKMNGIYRTAEANIYLTSGKDRRHEGGSNGNLYVIHVVQHSDNVEVRLLEIFDLQGWHVPNRVAEVIQRREGPPIQVRKAPPRRGWW